MNVMIDGAENDSCGRNGDPQHRSGLVQAAF